jgi:hypothetical protein
VSVGNGSSYTGCDGIPRYKFHSSPTITTTSTAFVVSVEPGSWTYAWEERPPEPRCKAPNIFCLDLMSKSRSNRENYGNIRPAIDDFVGYCMDSDYFPPDPPGSCYLSMWNDEIVLLHWGGTLASNDSCDGSSRVISPVPFGDKPVVVTTDAITFKGRDLDQLGVAKNSETWRKTTAQYIRGSVLPGPFTFTSPSIYIAHRAISAMYRHMPEWSQWDVTTLRPDGVWALNQEDVYSQRPVKYYTEDGLQYAKLVAQGKYNPDPSWRDWGKETVPVDFANLIEPVPASVYYDARWDDCYGISQTHCATITEDSYRPRIAIKDSAWRSIAGKHSLCSMPFLNDPPIILRIESTIAAPSIPAFTTAARLGDAPPQPQPPQTAAPMFKPARGPTGPPIQAASSQKAEAYHDPVLGGDSTAIVGKGSGTDGDNLPPKSFNGGLLGVLFGGRQNEENKNPSEASKDNPVNGNAFLNAVLQMLSGTGDDGEQSKSGQSNELRSGTGTGQKNWGNGEQQNHNGPGQEDGAASEDKEGSRGKEGNLNDPGKPSSQEKDGGNGSQEHDNLDNDQTNKSGQDQRDNIDKVKPGRNRNSGERCTVTWLLLLLTGCFTSLSGL